MNALCKMTGAALGVCLASLALCSCSNLLSSTEVTRNIFYTDTGVNAPDEFPVLRAQGYASISSQRGPSESQKQIQAMKASKIEAYRELAEQLYGMRIRSTTSIRDSAQGSDRVSASVDALVQGARVIRQYPLHDSYVTELELDSRAVYDLYQMRGAF